jgi:hypothetical protein
LRQWTPRYEKEFETMDYDDMFLDDVDPGKIGGNYPAPGRYHGIVRAIDPNDPQTGKLVVDVEILAGTTPEQEGRVQRLFFAHQGSSPNATAAAKRKKLTLAIALGLTSREEIAKAKAEGKPLRLDFRFGIGREFLFEVVYNEKTKSKTSVDWGMWPLGAPEAADIPIKRASTGDGGAALPEEIPF